MAARPLLLIGCALAILALASPSAFSSSPHDLIVGNRVPGDRLIQSCHVEKDASLIGLEVSVSKTFAGDRISNITQVKALDQHTNGHGATAILLAGGFGFKYATIHFRSERFRAIDFVVELYGK